MQEGDFGAQAQGLTHVVGDEDGCYPQAVAQFEELVLQFDARYGIQRAERFVEKQELWFGGERPRNADALALATGKLARIALEKLGWFQSHLMRAVRRRAG